MADIAQPVPRTDIVTNLGESACDLLVGQRLDTVGVP